VKKNVSAIQRVLVPVIVLLFVTLAACGSKINQANFDKIEAEMTEEEVQRILGEPTESSSLNIGGLSGASSTWTDEEATISIQFFNGKVKVKEFSKPGKRSPE